MPNPVGAEEPGGKASFAELLAALAQEHQLGVTRATDALRAENAALSAEVQRLRALLGAESRPLAAEDVAASAAQCPSPVPPVAAVAQKEARRRPSLPVTRRSAGDDDSVESPRTPLVKAGRGGHALRPMGSRMSAGWHSGAFPLHVASMRSMTSEGLRPEKTRTSISTRSIASHLSPSECVQCRRLPVLHPNGRFMTLWRPVLLAAVLFGIAMAPFDIAFCWWKPPKAYKSFSIALDIFFFVDMVLNFNIAFIHKAKLVTDRCSIAEHYALTFLIPDIAANLPIDWLTGRHGKSRKLMKIIKLPKLFRFMKLIGVLRDQTQYFGVCCTLGAVLLLAHYYSCIWVWLFLGDCATQDGGMCPQLGQAYLEGLSVSVAGLAGADSWTRLLDPPGVSWLASSREPGQPLRPGEDLLAASMPIAGVLLISCLFANMASALTSRSAVARVRSRMLQRRKAEMRLADVPRALQEKVAATYEHLWRFGGDEWDGMLRDPALSLDLRRNLALHVYGQALRKVPILKRIPDKYLKCLAQKVEMRLYTPGDLLVLIGEVGTELFIIHSGSVQPVDGNDEPLRDVILAEGSFFGEICFFHPGSRRTASIRCMESCKAMVLTIGTFKELNLSYLLKAIRREARKLEKDYVSLWVPSETNAADITALPPLPAKEARKQGNPYASSGSLA